MNTQILMVLDVLAKSVAVLLFAAALQSLWRKASAAQRSLVWLAAFTVLLLLPLTAIMKPVWTVPVPDRTAPPPVLHEQPVIQSVPVIPEYNLAPLLPPVAEPAWQMPQLSLWQWLGLAWLAGVTVLLLRRVAGAWQLRRLYKESFACETPRISALASRLASELGVRRCVDLRLSSKVTVPLTWGFLKPVLLLPADALEWQEAPLHAALCHELGHIRHWDALSRLLMSVLCALQWPNALLWLAAKSWRTAQEQACDDLVLNSGASKEAYAMQLLESARSVQRLGFLHAALTMAQPSTLETRLSAIMDPTRDRRPMRRSALLAGLAFAFSLLLLCAALQLRAEGPSRVTLDAGNLHLTCDEFHFNDLARQTGIATGHVIVNVTRDDGAASPIHEGKADEVEFDLGKKQAILRGHPEILMGDSHRHFGTGDDTKMVIHWDGSHIRTDTHGPAKTELLPGAQFQVKPLTNAAGVESPFKNVQITAKQTNFDPVRNVATAKGQVEVTVTTNGNPPAIYRGKADALEYDTVKKEVALHGHAEIADSATGDFLSFDDKDVIIKWDTPKGSWQLRMPKTTDAAGKGAAKESAVASPPDSSLVTSSIRSMEMLDDVKPLQVGDVVSLRIVEDGERVLKLRVQQSGDIQTPHLGLMKATGETCKKIAFRMKSELEKQYFEKATVIVTQEKEVKHVDRAAEDFAYFTVFGQVQRQGKYELPDKDQVSNKQLTVTGAIKLAGGTTSSANLRKVHVIRKTGEGERITITVNLEEVMKNGQAGAEKDILIRPNDVIVVYERVLPKAVTMMGDAVVDYVKSPVRAKADHIIIPTVLFKESTLDEAVEFLRVKAKELDPDGKGVNILVNVGPQSPARAARLTMDLKQIPLSEALRYVAGLANLEIKVDDNAFTLQEPGKKDTANIPKGTLEFKGGTLVLDHATAPSPVLAKANQIILPSVVFKESTVDEALDFLRVKSKELDPAKEGVNIVLKAGPKAKAQDARLTMDLKNIPLSEALHYVAELANLELIADDHAVILQERSKNEPAAEQKGKAGAAAVPAKGWFTVFGHVMRQGKYELAPEEKLTLSQALLRAGGLVDPAKKVHVVRMTPEGRKTINVNYDNVMKGGKTEEDIQIEPDDVIIVDEKILNF